MVELSKSMGMFLKAENVQEGDLVTFKDEGAWVDNPRFPYEDGNPRKDFVITVEHDGQEYSLRLNKFSKDEILPVYGNDTATWIGKKARVSIESYRSLGKKGIILAPVA